MTARRFVWSLAIAALGVLPALAASSTLERTVESGERLEIRVYSGTIRIVAGDDGSLRVEAEHAEDEVIALERRGAAWIAVPSSWEEDSRDFALRLPDMARVRVSGAVPPPVDLVVTMPPTMSLLVETARANVIVEGVTGPVDVTSMFGNVTVDGGGTPVRLRSMIGRIELRGARGRVTVEAATGGISVAEVGGELRVETTTGDIHLEDLEALDVEATTIDGDIELKGPVTLEGRYELSTHAGDIDLFLDGPIDAQFDVRALRGAFDSDLRPEPPPENGRGTFTLGAGSARLQVESFSGRIRILGGGDGGRTK